MSLTNLVKKFIQNTTRIEFPYNLLNYDNIQIKAFKLSIDDFSNKNDFDLFTKKFGTVIDVSNALQKYCEQDVLFLKTLFNLFYHKFKELDINMLSSYSVSSLSVKYYFKKYKYITNQVSCEIEDYTRRAYFGGRCEVFGNPKPNTTILHYDFPGMYKICMQQKFPIGVPQFIVPSNFDKPGFYTIEYESNMYLPILPVKYDKLYFVNGTNIGTFWFEEILLFIRHGGFVKKIINALVYPEYGYIFTDFINKIDAFKTSDLLGRYVTKMLINNLYGRLGMQAKNLSFDTIITNSDNLTEYIELENNLYLTKLNKQKINYTNVPIAAAITSKARIKLYENLYAIYMWGGDLLYCDTDSIIASFIKPPIGQTIGDINFDPTLPNLIFTDGVFLSPKTYGLKNETTEIIRLKGFSCKNITFEQLKQAFINRTPIKIPNQMSIHTNCFKINYVISDKWLGVSSYNKRKFINSYETQPLNLEELTIFKKTN
jgi:hypothetical protein